MLSDLAPTVAAQKSADGSAHRPHHTRLVRWRGARCCVLPRLPPSAEPSAARLTTTLPLCSAQRGSPRLDPGKDCQDTLRADRTH